VSDGASNAKASWIVGFDKSDPFAYARTVALKDSMLFAWNRTPFEMELGLALETKPKNVHQPQNVEKYIRTQFCANTEFASSKKFAR
jgi:hypothetical protein